MSAKRFLFVMGEGGGNVPPQLGLARKLITRGHDVRVLTEPCVEQDVLATGASYASFTLAPHRNDRSRESDFVRDFEARTPVGALAAFRDRMIFGPAQAFAADTMAEIERWRPDVVAPDWLRTGAAVAAEAAGLPTALLVHGLNLLPEPGKPPPGFGYLPAGSVLDRARDLVFGRGYLYLFNRGLRALNETRRAYGLPRLAHVREHFERQTRFLCMYPEAFDFPANSHPPNLRYVGPVLEQPAWAASWVSPWDPDDPRPLVVVSMSTTFMSQGPAVQRCIEALSSMDVRGLITVGPALDPGSLRATEGVAVVRSAPHDVVFPHAAAVVTHAGLGTVMRALAHGLPVVCMPMGRDQHDVAARVRWHGAGLDIGRDPAAATIRGALGRVLEDDSFRESAQRQQEAIQRDTRDDRAVAEVEGLAFSGLPFSA